MSYEIKYHYHEEISRGEYDKSETKTKTVKIGSPTDELPIEAVASKILSQLANRKMLVIDVEIYEMVKKKVSYKETDDGIVIKNKKFKFDDGPVAIGTIVEEMVETPHYSEQPAWQPTEIVAGPPRVVSPPPPPPSQPQNRSVLRHEYFYPTSEFGSFVDYKNKNLTSGKRYPILAERNSGHQITGMLYTVINDIGQEVQVSERVFTPSRGIYEDPDAVPDRQGNLNWSNFVDDQVPDLRRR